MAEQQRPAKTLARNGRIDVVDLEERNWLARHLRGDARAFSLLLRAYQRPVYSYLLRFGFSREERDDLFQEIFLKIHAGAASYHPSRPLKPWIFTIAANTVRNLLRKPETGNVSTTSDDILPPDPHPLPEKQLETENTVRWLQTVLAGLPISQRETLLLSAVDDLRQKDIAEIQGIPLNTVKTNLRRARLALAKARARYEQSDRTHDDSL